MQFTIWTIIGIATFLAIVFQSDPSNINDLPAIPPGFLQLMGISAGGYLAGKIARQAGPTLSGIACSSPSGNLDKITFQLTGSALSKAASFSIDDKPIFSDMILGKDGTPSFPEIVEQDPTITDTSFARILKFSVNNPPKEWFAGPHKFTITNPDAQKAVFNYQIFRIDNVTIANNILTLTGACLDGNLKVQYQVGGGASMNATAQPNQTSTTTFTFAVQNVAAAAAVTVTVADNAGVKVTKTNITAT